MNTLNLTQKVRSRQILHRFLSSRGLGYGTKIIEYLCNYVEKYDLSIIVVSHIISPTMLAITEKLKFNLYKHDNVMKKFKKCRGINGFIEYSTEMTAKLEKIKNKK